MGDLKTNKEEKHESGLQTSGAAPEIIEVENTLDALQEKVGGYIETVTLASDTCIVCNEEGLLRGMAPNVIFCGMQFVGPILIVGVEGENFCNLADAQFWRKELLRARGRK